MEAHMRNKEISGWLKALCVLLAILGVVVFGFIIRQWLFFFVGGASLVISIASTLYTALFCYLALYQFYLVTREIGNDNSFSLENANAFHRMGIFGICIGAGYVIRAILLAITGTLSFYYLAIFAVLLVISLAFFVLCEALSKLIQGAYAMKQENDLTI